MRVLVVGSGAREHTLVWKLFSSPLVESIYCAPGNAGTAVLAHPVPIPADDVGALAQWARENRIDLTVVGPEVPLAAGIVNVFQQMGLRIFGPTQEAATIEASKVWAKGLMSRYGIPTARWACTSDVKEGTEAIKQFDFPVAIKADGLAAGKGVTIVHTPEEAEKALTEYIVARVFGEAGRRVVLEEFLDGIELSVFALADGSTVVPLVPARDFKRALDGDQGPNTGGMGSYAPPSFAGADLMAEIRHTILEPAVRAMAAEGRPYKGVLYGGLMITTSGPKALEFNCRFGDPETQVVLPLLKSDLVPALEAAIDGHLGEVELEWEPGACCGVVLASGGYPGSYQTGFPIAGLDDVDPGVLVFHAGTKTRKGERPIADPWERLRQGLGVGQSQAGTVVTAGGRVLTVVATGDTLAMARQKAYAGVARIRFEGAHYRKDIAASEGESPPVQWQESGAPVSIGLAAKPDAAIPERLEEAAPPDGTPDVATTLAAGPAMASAPAPSQEAARKAQSLVAVVMGSATDGLAMRTATEVLAALRIPHQVVVMSAHRNPEKVREFALQAASRGIRVIVAGAGGAAHLPGVLASWTTVPVIGVPLAGSELRGVDALYSMVQMPVGVPVATVGIGESGARNAAYLAAAILALSDEEVRRRYEEFRRGQSQG